MSDSASTSLHRKKRAAFSGEGVPPITSGKAVASHIARKIPATPARIHFEPGTHGSAASARSASFPTFSPSVSATVTVAVCETTVPASSSGRSRYQGLLSSNLHVPMAKACAIAVAASAVPMIAVGFLLPAAASKAITVTGISVIELVLIASSMHIAFVATPGRWFSFSSSFMARNPSGVAALFSPRIFAAIFMMIAPIAG